MFETLSQAPADKIFELVAKFRADTRPEKLDLGIGVYKDQAGKTPVMQAVRRAEQMILDAQTTKTYVGVAGNAGFRDAVRDLVFGDAVSGERVASVQAPGGTGALWVLMKLVDRARNGGRVLISDPTWPNHEPMLDGAGLKVETYPYFDAATRSVRFDDMLQALDSLGPDDTVLLHGCCHNPTGANLTPAQWDEVAESLNRTGALPLIDLAYQGFGDGLEDDVYGVRKVAATCDEMLLAFSASKNFGLYRERAGVSFAVARDKASAGIVGSQMGNIIRSAWSQSPDHGAEVVRLILTDPDLRKDWEDELTEMRETMLENRKELAAALRKASNSGEFDFIADHRGMFSLIGISPDAVTALRENKAIYLIGDSRMNVAGLPQDGMDQLAESIIAVTRT
ncbi:MAG: aspartate/tyrosine/aromatic aminotransferase [Hyphomicrobiaceae bacterium]|nr:aspartate/tyrosine/aromatic aminotransferase [Hyphomicrobiaceae bacterium]MCC0022967.1 aspartate/tyrosine/aromatic aminotransferase [Hyphomicrobiaceae bacterium]